MTEMRTYPDLKYEDVVRRIYALLPSSNLEDIDGILRDLIRMEEFDQRRGTSAIAAMIKVQVAVVWQRMAVLRARLEKANKEHAR